MACLPKRCYCLVLQDVVTAKFFVEQVPDEEQRRIESFKLSSMVNFCRSPKLSP